MKVVINACFGGFGLSDAAYEKLIEWGVPVRAYVEQKRDPETHLYIPEPLNEGEVIFDRDLKPPQDEQAGKLDAAMRHLGGRYWDTWTRDSRADPRIIRLVEELGEEAQGRCAKLKVVEIPDGTDYIIEEYDGNEHVAEKHETWS